MNKLIDHGAFIRDRIGAAFHDLAEIVAHEDWQPDEASGVVWALFEGEMFLMGAWDRFIERRRAEEQAHENAAP